jgi:hypothetical protein
MNIGHFQCACRFYRQAEFEEAALVEECAYHTKLREALRDVLDSLGAIGKPWELRGHGFSPKDAERICEYAEAPPPPQRGGIE